jgi:hypothetical protein
MGICLYDCYEYGSPHALRQALICNPGLIVPKVKAKKYKYARMCLIVV